MRPPSEPIGADTLGPPVEFDGPDPPDWLVEWEGSILPRGGGFRGRLPLWDRPGPAEAQVAYPTSRRRATPPAPVTLSAELAGLLRSWLAASFPDGLTSRKWECMDGLPIEIVVYRREPSCVVRVRCNLGDALGLLPPGSHDRVAARVAEAVTAGVEIAPVYRIGFLLLCDVTLSLRR